MKGLVVVMVLLVATNVSGQAENKGKAPQAVMDAFKKQYPNATIKGVSSEKEGGKTVYEIESMDGNQRRDLVYDANGTVLSTEELISNAQVPKVVTDALAVKYPNAPIVSAEKLTDKDGMRYEVVLKVNGKNKSVEVDPSGKIK
jgi:nucleoid-associated protein YgaU